MKKTDKTQEKENLNTWINDPLNYRCGLFYYNKEDKRLLVPKRMKLMGWTLNFANPFAMPLFGVIILYIIYRLFFY